MNIKLVIKQNSLILCQVRGWTPLIDCYSYKVH